MSEQMGYPTNCQLRCACVTNVVRCDGVLLIEEAVSVLSAPAALCLICAVNMVGSRRESRSVVSWVFGLTRVVEVSSP